MEISFTLKCKEEKPVQNKELIIVNNTLWPLAVWFLASCIVIKSFLNNLLS